MKKLLKTAYYLVMYPVWICIGIGIVAIYNMLTS